eukprot:9843731-Lingulodinium_polyedra.AAC.1
MARNTSVSFRGAPRIVCSAERKEALLTCLQSKWEEKGTRWTPPEWIAAVDRIRKMGCWGASARGGSRRTTKPASGGVGAEGEVAPTGP